MARDRKRFKPQISQMWHSFKIICVERRLPSLVFPDPVAFRIINLAVSVCWLAAAIVNFIPANGVEEEFSVCRAVIMQWLTTNDVVRQFLDELGYECVERLGILAMCEMITL